MEENTEFKIIKVAPVEEIEDIEMALKEFIKVCETYKLMSEMKKDDEFIKEQKVELVKNIKIFKKIIIKKMEANVMSKHGVSMKP